VSELPHRPSLEHLRKQAKARKRERGIRLSQAQHELARDYGFDSWPKLVRHVPAEGGRHQRLDVGVDARLVLFEPRALRPYEVDVTLNLPPFPAANGRPTSGGRADPSSRASSASARSRRVRAAR
jgi:hypothetical protein